MKRWIFKGNKIKEINKVKVVGTDIKSILEAILPGGKTGEKYVDGYFEVPIIINNNSDIAGFQIEILGGNIIDASGGISKEYDFDIYYGYKEIKVVGLTRLGDKLPKGGKQILLYLTLESIESEICITNLILSVLI